MPILAPGQEWRVFWDSAIARKDLDIPDQFEVTVSYRDSKKRPLEPSVAILDWTIYKDAQFVEILGQHHAAKALRELAETVKGFAEHGGSGLSIYTRDGAAKDALLAERREEQRRALQQLRATRAAEPQVSAIPLPAVEASTDEQSNGEVRPRRDAEARP